ncbi:Outer membrane protein beta-barrel domain-containing protein [Hymenobacter gelipurpurascens]|uniref:Outer membrane protein beta-barrel domain-containing protein n=1 Tax=Hymenobacter gelipurpurascens TaxID=89968 RepID=A0A212TAJ5_9BACT|nr:porin family protein [Hymenobacter gelipurpurascens]SNC62880.1 Outer membrane protein beta-barrel domain-containing protein [Hymenobacter gelipurpurascens]
MKRISSLLALLALVLLLPGRLQASARPATHLDDTIIVKLPNQSTMTLFVKNKAQLREMRNYKLDSLILLLDGYITQAEAAGKTSKSDQVTMEFYPAKDQPGKNVPEQIRITVRSEDGKTNTKTMSRTDVVMGRVFGVTVYDKADGKDDDHVSVRISSTPDSVKQAQRKAKQEERANRAVHTSFDVDLGLNTLVNKSVGVGENAPDLRPVGSRYLSLNYHYNIRVGSKESPFHIITGPELAFNNFMLDKNYRFVDDNDVTTIVADARNLEKSKLTMTTLNIPLMASLQFKGKNDHDGFHIGAGGFAGYRLGSHTKLKYEEEGRTRKDKDRGSYNLSDFQYGLQGNIGIRGLDLFMKYNLNDVFKDNRGPQAQALSFGITLLH